MAQLHRDLLVGLQEECDRDGKQEVVEGEHKDERPRIVELLADRVVLGRVSNAEGEPDDGEDRPY